MNTQQAHTRINKVLQEIGSVQFKIHTLSIELFKSIRDDNLDWNVMNHLYTKMGRGVNKQAYREWVLDHTPLLFDKGTASFKKSKKGKWTNMSIPMMDNSPFYTYNRVDKTKDTTFDLNRSIGTIDKRLSKLIEEAITNADQTNGDMMDKIASLKAIELALSALHL